MSMILHIYLWPYKVLIPASLISKINEEGRLTNTINNLKS